MSVITINDPTGVASADIHAGLGFNCFRFDLQVNGGIPRDFFGQPRISSLGQPAPPEAEYQFCFPFSQAGSQARCSSGMAGITPCLRGITWETRSTGLSTSVPGESPTSNQRA